MMTECENYVRTLQFRNPEWMPCVVKLSPSTWMAYRESLEEIVLRYPRLLPGYEKGSKDFDEMPSAYEVGYHRDHWGCLWHTVEAGMEGQVVEHPLENWDALDTYTPPPLTIDEEGERDWEAIAREIEQRKKDGLLTVGQGDRLFDRMYLLRGFENLMIDIATDDPHLPRFIDMLLDYELRMVGKWLDLGVDIVAFHTDIGTQRDLMISPAKFRKYIKPMFKEIFQTCRRAGALVRVSSDGCLLEIVDDLIECGASLHDPQLRANTLEGIVRTYKGKLCVNLDLDRQMFPFCKPEDITAQVKDVVDALGSPEGGLMIQGVVSGDNVPLENIDALCAALEEQMERGVAP